MSLKVYFDEYGDPPVLKMEDEVVADPGPGEVRITNRAIGVNPFDWKMAAGTQKQQWPLPLPIVPGNESAGVVDAVGEGVTDFAVGDEVIWLGMTNGYRAQALTPAAALVAKPANIDFDQAACLPVAAGTANTLTRQIHLNATDTVLIHDGSGGRGIGSGADRGGSRGTRDRDRI